MKKLLMVCYGGGHVKIVAPLYQVYKDKYDVSILALTTAGKYLADLNIPHFGFAKFDELVTPTIEAWGEQLSAGITGGDVSKKETIYYLGLSFAELVEELGSESKAKSELEDKGRSILLPLRVLRHVFDQIKPDLVLATNSPRAERAALMVAKERGIPSVCVNDNVWIEGGARYVAENALATNLCVLSEQVKEQLLEVSDFDAHNIKVTGTPVFDNLKALRSLVSDSSRKLILFADCDLPKENSRFPGTIGDPTLGDKIRRELDSLAGKHGWQIVFRRHPSQEVDYSEYKNITVSEPKDSLHALLPDCAVVITAISTVGIEGKVLGAGLVSIEGTVYRSAGSYEALGLSTGVSAPYELERAIEIELCKVTSSDDNLYPGNSISNIESCIVELLK